ncbi:MAG: histidine kinase [Beijerinckiaceae bacterium]|nr:histidine kinase [Beijerinckiaceae bacterium]
MPTLFRFLGVLAVLGGIGFGAMLALAMLVQPEQREMSVPIDPKRFAR